MKRFLLNGLIAILFMASFRPIFASNFIPADNPNIQYFGRWDFADPLAPTHSWPGVSVYADFEGTSIGVRFNDNFCYWNVIIDGGEPFVFKGTTDGVANYTLATGLADGPHTLLFHKRNETTWLKKTFQGMILDDGKTLLTPPEKPEKKIEFIGDSFTSGEWNELVGAPPSSDDAPWTNVYEGFGPIIGRHYGAQYHLTSISGWGLVVEWQGDYTKNLPSQFNKTHTYTPIPLWDYEEWIPNVVVIGLGLNDYNAFGGWNGPVSTDNRNLYKTRYHEFIATIRDVYPGVNILAVGQNGVAWIISAVGEVVTEEQAAGHGDVFYGEYPTYPSDAYANYHPTVPTHHLIADRLIAAIDSLNLWEGRNDTVPPVFSKLPASPFMLYESSLELNVETDTYATVRYSEGDKPYADMENVFTATGKRKHSVTIPREHGRHYTLYLRASDVNGNAMASSAVVSFDVDTTKVLLNWTMPEYDDTAWKTGPTPIGNGAGAAVSTEASAANTLYFRRVVTIPDLSAIKTMGLKVVGFDGAVVYVNGQELDRYNLPEEMEIGYETHALKPEAMSKTFAINSKTGLNLFKSGENLIAVEIHASSDTAGVSFDSQLFNNKGEYYFRLGAEWKYFDGGAEPLDQLVEKTSAVNETGTHPAEFKLFGNFPNPFNPSTDIQYSIPGRLPVHIDVFDVQGRRLAAIDPGLQDSGIHHVTWNAEGFSSGVYFYTVKAGTFVETRKCMLLK